MAKALKIVLAGFAVYAVVAFAILQTYTANPESLSWQEREIFNRKYISRLELGERKESVLRLLGPPDISEAHESDQGDILVLFYRTQHVRSDGMTTRDETTPLIFREDRLLAWGESAYTRHVGEPLRPTP
ncbi:DUF3192 domain-containing protein [Aliidiomarina maris]|uniref:Uncharacterized protein DUF3192 n=1 Tax=Aliidiomarina maris TaxID=531312 RepID=A0A327WV81_9GAMM|nr:DUF3192 domain-containing protein [Aliidiomarina maris]MBA3989069.1 hypothetical protein [Idiomarina sp.]RAJ96544.1 uncharacterized protein DUF3192 [Aliidiomarina maris]RUO23710.1 hypothetical protein CWE07_09345 [Aliidiomarina maris]